MVELADERAELEQAVRERFSEADVTSNDLEFQGWLDQVMQTIESPTKPASLPLDLQGTIFQRRVWEALRRIPPGETTTYSELAKAIGQPTASRAVAGACAANPVAILIPCHRVIRKDGHISGYRWGQDRKRRLLDQERIARAAVTDVS